MYLTQTCIFIAITGISMGLGVCFLITYLLGQYQHRKKDYEEIKSTSFTFSGNLKQTSLLDAVQFLEIGRREGVLHIYCGRRKGYLTFSKGKVIDAFYRNYTGREAIMQMFEIQEGDFYFEPKKISQPRIITEPILDLVFEWDNRRDSGNN